MLGVGRRVGRRRVTDEGRRRWSEEGGCVLEATVFILLYSREARKGEESGPLMGLSFFIGPCRAARRAGVAAQAWHVPPGRASMGTKATGPCLAWAEPKICAFGWAIGLRAAWTSINTNLNIYKHARTLISMKNIGTQRSNHAPT